MEAPDVKSPIGAGMTVTDTKAGKLRAPGFVDITGKGLLEISGTGCRIRVGISTDRQSGTSERGLDLSWQGAKTIDRPGWPCAYRQGKGLAATPSLNLTCFTQVWRKDVPAMHRHGTARLPRMNQAGFAG